MGVDLSKTSGDISKSISEGITESSTVAQRGIADVGVSYRTTVLEAGDVAKKGIKSAEVFGIDTERSLTKGVVNITGDVMHTGRYVSKNVVSLVDNFQDNITHVVQDIRVDITNTVQITMFIMAVGVAAGFILYGDKIMEKGVQFGGIEFL